MAIHEFECPKCGHKEERLILSNDNRPLCPKCLILLDKIISLSNFILKGNCWAKDNYNKEVK